VALICWLKPDSEASDLPRASAHEPIKCKPKRARPLASVLIDTFWTALQPLLEMRRNY
jgi:hypothetical protein